MSKVVLVTGASSGIGRDLALMLAREGYSVALAARRVEILEKVAGDIASIGGRAEVFKADLSIYSDSSNLVRSVVEKLGRIDILINNAGFAIYGPIDEISDEEIQRIFWVNVISPTILMREASRYMKKTGGGCIVNIVTLAVYTPMPWLSLYNATKAALKALTDVLRIELSPYGIRVIGVYPGYVDTDFHRNVVLTDSSMKHRWSVRGSSIAPVLRSSEVASEIVRRIKDPGFNGDIVISARYKLLRWLAHHFGGAVVRVIKNNYINNYIKRQG
ncbi:MAG TPA: SDR family NAD(P)-dependent oxidoreductase [Sulfolobales archaeon]|nr:SDR family NAD(P)-dependent oxidoreductase [Sulfolobales archaeon]